MTLAPVHTKPQRTALAWMRLAAQGLLPSIHIATAPEQASTPADVVSRMGMMQAQDLAQACWAVGIRLADSGLSTVHTALADGSIIRCWGARGTLMLLAPQVHAALLSVTAPRMESAMAAIRAREHITDAEIAKLTQVAVERCSGPGATRAELLEAFEQAGSETIGQRGYHLIVAVSVRGAIVQGPMAPGSNSRQLFMATDQWLPNHEENPDPTEALNMLVGTYIRSHGPATAHDCAWWLGLPLGPVRESLETQAAELPQRSLGGETYYYAAEHCDRWGVSHKSVHAYLALPGFDELLLGYKARWPTLDPQFVQDVTPGKNGIFLRTLVVASQVVGTWRVTGTGAKAQAIYIPFDKPQGQRSEAKVARALDAYLNFNSR